jgi:hypothetical protein
MALPELIELEWIPRNGTPEVNVLVLRQQSIEREPVKIVVP